MRHSGGVSDRSRVVILCGGWSSGRAQSQTLGKHVEDIIKAQYEVLKVDPIKDLARFAAQMVSARPDVLLNTLQGEDAAIIAGVLAITEIPYQQISEADSKNVAFDEQIVTLIEKLLSQASSKSAA